VDDLPLRLLSAAPRWSGGRKANGEQPQCHARRITHAARSGRAARGAGRTHRRCGRESRRRASFAPRFDPLDAESTRWKRRTSPKAMTKNARGGSRLTRRRIRLPRAPRAVAPIRVF